jgi:hypothetical protein
MRFGLVDCSIFWEVPRMFSGTHRLNSEGTPLYLLAVGPTVQHEFGWHTWLDEDYRKTLDKS